MDLQYTVGLLHKQTNTTRKPSCRLQTRATLEIRVTQGHRK